MSADICDRGGVGRCAVRSSAFAWFSRCARHGCNDVWSGIELLQDLKGTLYRAT